MEVVGGALLSAFLDVAVDRIASSRKFINFFQGEKAITFDEETLDKLEITLGTISVVLEDAENKQEKTPAVRRWLDNLKVAVNHADDLLDEINTECLRLKLDYEFQTEETEAAPNVSDTKLSFKKEFIEELMPQLKKITTRLDYFEKQINALGLQKFDSKEKYAKRVASSSVLAKTQIIRKDEEIEKLIQMVLSDEETTSDVSVIAITGLGGIGKTTRAQLVYDDERVKAKYKTTAWACVSEDYDALKITKAILMEVNSTVVDEKDDFNRLQVKLRNSLAEQHFLIILDDVWNQNCEDWQTMKNPLSYGSRGSKIIITTRSEKVALMMQNQPFHRMQPMNEDHSWSLFVSHAFDNEDLNSLQQYVIIGKEIVKKCKGLPLAIKTVASALRQKRDINEWRDTLNSEIWTRDSDFLPALTVSYKHLPSYLKCCFSFCAIFPKDIPFDKSEVVLLWMANGLIQPSTQKSLENIGRDYFEELRLRSLFEIVNGDKYLMHDLINDLARYVSGNFCVRVQDYERDVELPVMALHFSYLTTSNDTLRNFRTIDEGCSLRTFLPIHGNPLYITTLFFSDILPRFRRIRALSLSQYDIKVIPDSIGDLKHLRLFNLAETDIRKVSNAIGKCINLQTLILRDCRYLEEMPEDMRRLINLQHLDVRGVGNMVIQKMESWLTMLTNVKNLSVLVDKINGSVLEQSNKLETFQSLEITGLENVVKVESAERAELKYKNCINNLSFNWSGMAERSEDELNLLSKLQPHANIKQLSIVGYRGTAFSYWVGDSAFSNMEVLCLRDCKNCFCLPPLGQLTGLKELHISGMDGITEIGEEFYGNPSISKPFQALEELSFRRMAEWETWNTHPDNEEFSNLKKFCISDCPKLIGDIPYNLASLKRFRIEGLPQVAMISDLWSLKKMSQGLNHLDKLEVSQCSSLVSLPDGVDKLMIENCSSFSLSLQSSVIKQLEIVNCKHVEFPTSDSCNSTLTSLTVGRFGAMETIPLFSFSKLRHVCIAECPKLFKFSNGFHQTLTTMQSLFISYCNNLLYFPEGGLPAPNLKSFTLWGCKNLKSLPEDMQQLSSLCQLNIQNCPAIDSFPDGGLPSTLERLTIGDCAKLMICPRNWGLQRLPSVKYLRIGGVEDKLFPEEGLLPSSLHELSISGSPNLEALNQKGLQHLTALQTLSIYDCSALSYMPEEILASSLAELIITECPKLIARMVREKGEDWHIVSHIPLIEIDYEIVS